MLILKKYNWWKNDHVQISGHYWYNEEPIEPQKLASIVQEYFHNNNLQNLCQKLTGSFTIVISLKEKYIVISDAIGRYPLFYIEAPNGIILSDQPQLLPFDRVIVRQKKVENFFMQFGATPGNKTLIKGIYQTEAGTILELSKQEIKTKYYFIEQLLRPNKFEFNADETNQLLHSIFKKQLPADKSRQIILPLTAGYDSRLIAVMLKDYGYKNVLCCTWGRKNNPEMLVAQKIASKLGFQYEFIEYNRERIRNFTTAPHFLNWIKYTSHYTSMPYLQDYFAIQNLVNSGKIERNAMAIPGHSGDTYTGEHLSPILRNATHMEISNYIFSRFSNTQTKNRKEKEQVMQQIQTTPHGKQMNVIGFFDYWDLSVRQSKLVANSSSIFDYFGIENILPLSDQQFVEYFLSAPIEKRINQQLYISTLDEKLFKPHGLNCYSKKFHEPKNERIKQLVKKLSPKLIRAKYYQQKDIIYYHELTAILKKELGRKNRRRPKNENQYNSYIIQWYLHFLLGNDKKLLL